MFHDEKRMKGRQHAMDASGSEHHGRGRSERNVSRAQGRHGAEFDDFGHGRGRRERIFGQGDLRLVVLNLIAQKPSHGYELIKAISELVGDDYTPSPGVVYPTLMYLEESGMIQVAQEAEGKKQYAIIHAGAAYLTERQDELAIITGRIQSRKLRADSTNIPELHRAIHNIRMLLSLKVESTPRDDEKIKQMVKILDQAAADISQL